MTDFYDAMISSRSNANVCETIARFAASADRIPDGQDKGTAELRGRAVRSGLIASGLCLPYLASSGTGVNRLASYAMPTISAEGQAVIDQIGNAVQYAPSSGELAANLNSILAGMPALPQGEPDVIYAVASVSQSSYEYWETNTQSLTDQVVATYSGCLGQYSDEAVALENCMGISQGSVEPTNLQNGSKQSVFILATNFERICYPPSRGDIAESDFVGGFMGAIAGFATSPFNIVNVVGGAAVGALGTSAATGWFRVGRFTFCLATGGRLPRVEEQTK